MAIAAHDLELLSLADVAAPVDLPADRPTGPPEIPDNILNHPAIMRLRAEPEPELAPQPQWSCAELAGRLCELSSERGGAPLSAAFDLVLDAQLGGDPVAWVTTTAATFFPPDAAAGGVDLEALVVVKTGQARAAARAADVLVRSGAFGLVVLDLGASATLPAPLQGRLVQLALKHDAAVVCLTEKSEAIASLGSLVSLRGQTRRERVNGGFACRIRALKDKRRGPGWQSRAVRQGPAGVAC